MKIAFLFVIFAHSLVSLAEATKRIAFEHYHVVDDADEAIVEAFHYLDSMSMSMSMAPSTVAPSPSINPGPGPPSSPTNPSPTLDPAAPQPAPASGSGPPSATSRAPTPLQPSTFVPTATAPPNTPSTTALPTIFASDFVSSTPTEESTEKPKVFACTEDGIVLVENTPIVTTTIPIKVGYVVESSAFLDEFKDKLETQILKYAIIGALQCNSGGPVFGPKGNGTEIPMFTTIIGDDCTAQISFCTVLSTEFQIVAGDDLNPDTAAFLGYIKLQEDMNGGVFVEEIPILDRVTYRSPLPLLPPITSPGDIPVLQEVDSSSTSSSSAESLSLSPWTYGAVMAMFVGGVLALGMWALNRRTRNQRHMQLLEDMSLASGGQEAAHLA